MRQERLNNLIDELNQGSISSADREELMRYYNSFQVNTEWDVKQMGNYEETKAKIFNNLTFPGEKHKVTSFRTWIRWAAASVLLVAFSWFGYANWFMNQLIVVTTDKTSQEVLLPDGTRVVLNINSQISYPKSFESDRREVKFEGEGYFEVAKDSMHPFFIETDLIKVKVLGTEFNLKAYKDDPKFETSLIEGQVALLTKDEKNTLSVLKPHQKFIAEREVLKAEEGKEKSEVKMIVEPIQFIGDNQEEPVDLAWKEGKVAFSSTTLADIARILKRKYAIDIKIVDPVIAEYKYSAAFEGESVEEILKLLSLVKHFNYRKEGNDVIIY